MSDPNASDDAAPSGETAYHKGGRSMADSDAPNSTRVAGRAATGSAALPPGHPDKIGRFEIRALLGEGAFGRVYRGHDSELRREVAIKVPHTAALTDEFRERFLREARAIAAIHHPNVCPVYEVGTDGALPFIVMRFVAGTTLADIVDNLKTPMPPRNAAMIVRKLALGMAAAHAQNVTNRGLKPDNGLDGRATREVLITDFGLARMGGEINLTAKDSFLGTPAYTSPEQANRQMNDVGPLSDVYSLGVILYEMLTGDVPFNGSVMEVAIAHCIAAPTPPSQKRPGIAPELDAIVLKTMSKKPADRYPSAKALADALTDYLRPGSTGSTGSVELPAVTGSGVVGRGAAETVADKRSGRRTAPAVEVPARPQPVVELDEDEEDDEALKETRKSGNRKSAKQSKGKKKKRKEKDPLAKYGVPALAGVLGVVALVLLVVFLTRNKSPKETAQRSEPTPDAPAPQPPAARVQPVAAPTVPPPKANAVTGPEDVLRNKLLEQWRLTTGIATQAQFAEWGAQDKFYFVEFKTNGTATIGLDSLDPNVRLSLLKDNARGVIRFRVVSGDAIAFTDPPSLMPAGVRGGPFAANTTVTVQFVDDSLIMRYGANTARFKRVVRTP